MKEFLGMTHQRQHGKACFDNHALIPGAFSTQFEVRRDTLLIAETQISQGNRFLLVMLEQEVKILVRSVQGQPVPLDHAPGLIQQPPQPDANRPAAFVLTLASNLTFAKTFADEKEQ